MRRRRGSSLPSPRRSFLRCLLAVSCLTAGLSFCGCGLRPRAGRVQLAAADGDTGALWAPDRRLVEAVERLGGRVTKADVLERGLPATGLERQLLELARASGAGLRVNERGELLYDFPKDLSATLSARSASVKLQQLWTTIAPVISYAGRILFGVSLLVLVAVLYSAVVILMSTSTSEREDREGNRSTFISQNNFAMWFGEDIFWWLTPRPYGYYSYYGGGYYGDLYGLPTPPPPKMSFFEAAFSFVFGDGDPNEQLLNDTRWQLIGETIAQAGGSVVAEQLAPFLDPPTSSSSTGPNLDKAMLPVLLRFKGKPEVARDGTIVYVFPELQESRAAGELIVGDLSTKEMKERLQSLGKQTTAVERPEIVADYRRALEDLRRRSSSAPSFLRERTLRFSEADDGQLLACGALGAFSLLATLFIGSQILSGKALILARVYPIIGLLVQGFPLILGYTAGFLGIPLWRWLRLESENAGIQQRNAWREEWSQKLRLADSNLRDRLASAARWASERLGFGASVFDSAEPVSEVARRGEAEDLKSFDDRLKSRA
jgi:hypothetical protein